MKILEDLREIEFRQIKNNKQLSQGMDKKEYTVFYSEEHSVFFGKSRFYEIYFMQLTFD